NDYYLFKDFDKNYSIYGSIYADYHVPITAESRPNNTVLYGHNINVGTYFAKLTRYFPQINGYGYYSSHPTVQFDTIYEQGAYKIFGAIFINTQERHGEVYDYYRKRTFPDKEAFYDFVGNIMDRSVFYTGVDLEYGDEFLTLSTCFYPLGENVDTRFVVFARRVRAGESEEVDVQQYYVNPSPLFFDYWYNVQGGSWQGRSWDTSKVKGFDEFVAENPDSAIALQGA
ncbi:MAG: class B sortase, partial [Eubacterium sp.]|nr:class B sortase [Eubacterium sp.]